MGKNNNFSFKIKFNEIGKYSPAGQTLNIPETDLNKYSQETILRAKELKAKHGDKYNDIYYLERAKDIERDIAIGENKAFFKKRSLKCAVQEIDWAIYSYDEIIEMENNGVKIPIDVLKWAHTKQKEDQTDYIILSENSEIEETPTKEDVSGPDQLNNLRIQAIKDITLAQKITTETQQTYQQYETTSQKAKEIQLEKENSYKDTLNEINDLTKEWKNLNNKRQNGNFTREDQKRFNELGKLLNGTNGILMNEIQSNNNDLDKFLIDLNNLNQKILNGNEIATKTIQSGKELSEYKTTIAPSLVPGSLNDTGMSAFDSLSQFSVEQISDVAINTGKNLNNYLFDLSSIIKTNKNENLEKFAQDYTTLAQQTENDTRNTMGEDFDNKARDKNQPKEAQSNLYSIDMIFSLLNAQRSAAVTAISTADLIFGQDKVKSVNQKLQLSLNETDKSIKLLNQQANEGNAKHQQYLSDEEIFLTKLDDLQNTTPLTNSDNEDLKDENTTNNMEIDSLISQIKDTNDKDKSIFGQIKTKLSHSVSLNNKSQNIQSNLNKENNNFITKNRNAFKVASDTFIVGTGTVAKGFVTSEIGALLYSTGTSMLSNPFTAAAGMKFIIAGINLGIQGSLEYKAGFAAAAIGTVGMGASAIASGTINDTKTVIKDSSTKFKGNIAEFKQVQNDLDINNIDIEIPKSDQIQPTNNITAFTSNDQNSSNNLNQGNTQTTPSGKQAPKAVQTINQQQNNIINTTKFNENNETNNYASNAKLQIDNANNENQKISELVNNTQIVTNQSVQIHQQNLLRSNALNQEIILNQLKMQNSDTEQGLKSAQSQIQSIQNELETITNQDEQVSNIANQTLSKSLQQLSVFRQNTLKLTNYKTNIPTTEQPQQNETETSAAYENYNTEENTTLQTILNNEQNNADNQYMVLNSQLNQSENLINNTTNNINEESDIQSVNIYSNENAQENENDFAIEDINAISASATVNVNLNDSTITDEKTQRKLARFNTESIIDSKRKRKKVMAISASSRG